MSNQQNQAELKFTTCIHRSEKEEPKIGCCGDSVYGWVCKIRVIHGISPANCLHCNFYQKKET